MPSRYSAKSFYRVGDKIKIRSWKSMVNEFGNASRWNSRFPGWGKEAVCRAVFNNYIDVVCGSNILSVSIEAIENPNALA